MNEIIQKVRKLHASVAKAKGEFDLFAFFLREDAPDVWDLVVAARWIEADRQEALKFLSKRAQKALGSDITKLSRVVIVQRDSPGLGAVTHAVPVHGAVVEVRDTNFFGLAIRHGFIIAARRPRAAGRHPSVAPARDAGPRRSEARVASR